MAIGETLLAGHGIALVGAGNIGGDRACADERDVGGPFDSGA
ncbi:MAG: hypothetical protein ACLQFW_05430 [Xanthobacteraceae bacterium]